MARLSIPILYAGQQAQISWSVLVGNEIIRLERRFDYDFDDPDVMTWDVFDGMWTGKTWNDFNARWVDKAWDDFNIQEPSYIIYEGAAFSFSDIISRTASFVVYRLSSSTDVGFTWNIVETTEHIEIIPNRPPEISGQDSDLGTMYKGFSIPYVITDPDPNSTIITTVYIDKILQTSNGNTQQGVSYFVNFTDNQIFAYPDGSKHTVEIIAVDNWDATTKRTYGFTAVVDLITNATMYLLKKEIEANAFYPIAKMVNDEYYDYLNVGKSTYKVRVVDQYDNFTDSNEVTLDIAVEGGKIAEVIEPGNMRDISIRINTKPSRSIGDTYIMSKVRFEGRQKPVHIVKKQVDRVLAVEGTHISEAEKTALSNLFQKQTKLIYRDIFKNHIVGHVISKSTSVVSVNEGPENDNVVNYSFSLEETDYTEAIEYD